MLKNFNPRPPTRGTTSGLLSVPAFCVISIHVPLRGGRRFLPVNLSFVVAFQSTSPYAGDDSSRNGVRLVARYFNPRPPTRGTTCSFLISAQAVLYFNPRPPTRGTTIKLPYFINRKSAFQSTSPYAGDDLYRRHICRIRCKFQSTSPYAGDDRCRYSLYIGY